jgi:LuxR family transcriptional regulator, maltose regulon positive regulatory protein
VGLQMAAISLSGRAQADDFIERFSGSSRYVLDYLTDEVLDRQPGDLRTFLLGTSILTRLSASLCDAVLQRDDSARILERLEEANLFLIPLDDVRFWYRYHHLFSTLLQHQLTRSLDAAAITDLHRRASAWYLANGMPEPALEHALAAKDAEGAAAILAVHALPRTLSGDAQSVLRWFDALPRERVDDDVDLLLIRAVACVADYQLERARDTILRAEALLGDDSPPAKRGALLGVRGSVVRMMGNVEEGTADLRLAMTLVEPGTFWFSMVSYQFGMNAVMRADVREVVDGLAVARSHHAHAEQIIIAVLAQTYTAYAELYGGRPERARALAEEMFAWIDLTEGIAPGRPLDAFPNAVLADVHLTWNELDAARAFAEKSTEHGRRGFTIALFEASRCLARVADGQRDWETARRAAQEAARAIRGVRTYFPWYSTVESMIQKIVYRSGDVQAAARWIESNEAVAKLMQWEVRRVDGFWCDTPLLLAARVSIDAGRCTRALAVLDEVEGRAAETGRVLTQIEALILRALAEAHDGRVEDGVAVMARALGMAAGPRAVQLFAAEGAAILPLVERAAPRVADRDFVTRVIAALDVPGKTAPAGTLSERELEVLRLVAVGASNQEAARKLFIAASTVKKHLENIYAKLAVGGRTEAIARAREMKLL